MTRNEDRLSALSILSIEKDYILKLDFEDINKSSILKRQLFFYLPNKFVHHFVIYFWPGEASFFNKIELLRSGTLFHICNYFIENC